MRGNRKRKVRRVTDNDGGYSVYVGARSSTSYGNIYDKEAESNDEYYAKCWRFEVRFSNEAATHASYHLYIAGRTIPSVVSSTVWRWYRDRGVQCPWSKGDEDHALYAAKAPETDVSRSLRWLDEQVGPTVARLCALGYQAAVYDALGLGVRIPASDDNA